MRSKTIDDIFLNISHFLDHFMMLIFAKAAYDAGKYFGLSYDEIIFYATLGFIFFGAFAPAASYLADKYSRSILMVIFHFGIGISAIAAGFSNSIFSLTIALAIIGIFAAIYHPVGIAMLLSKNEKTGLRLGINGVFGNMGVAAAPLTVGAILLFGDWRMCFFIPGLFCLFYGILFFLSLKDKTKNLAISNLKKDGNFARNWQWALSSIALSTLGGGFIFGAMTFIVPRYFEVSLLGISNSVAITGALASIVYACASFAQIAIGKLIDKFSPKTVLTCIAIGQIVFIFLTSLFSDWALFFTMIVAMLFVFGQIPINDVVLSRYIPDNRRGRILSMKFMLNLGVGASVLPICSFFLQNGYEIRMLFSVMSVIAIFALVAALILPNQDDKDRMDKLTYKETL
ncbi:MAG: MFS transporter [Aestuariivita sp.]|nr:MFS transporter [Aestuariivita sp.]